MKISLLPATVILFIFAFVCNTQAQTIISSPATGNITACAGTASVSPHIQQFSVSGSGLSANITLTAPANFQVSLSAGSGYGSSLTLTRSGGTVTNTIIYVRSSASVPAGNISGNVLLASTGATSQTVAINGTINPLPAVNPVSNQTIATGAATAPVDFTGTGAVFTWVNDTQGIGLAASGTGNIPSFPTKNTTADPLTATITVTPEFAGFAYIPNINTNKTEFETDTVSVLNTVTNKIIATIPVGKTPDAISASPDGSRVYISNGGSNNVSVINTSTNKVVATIMVGALPRGVVVSPDGSTVYVGNDGGTVSIIDAAANTVTATIPVGEGEQDVAISPDGKKLYVITFDEPTSEFSVVNTATNTVVSNLPFTTTSIPHALAVSPDGSLVYVAFPGLNNVMVINTASNTVTATIPVGASPQGVVFSLDGGLVYVSNSNSDNVSVINSVTHSVVATIPVGHIPTGVSLSPDGSLLYVINNGPGTLSIISTKTNTVLATVNAGNAPQGIGNFVTGGTGCSGVPMKFTITVNPATNASLTGLKLSSGILSPVFAAGTISYTASVANTTASVTVTPTTGNANETVKVNGTTVTSGQASAGIPLIIGANTITTTVSYGASTKTYTIIVTRASANNAQLASISLNPVETLVGATGPGYLNFTATVANTVATIQVIPTAKDPDATITVNGKGVISGSASASIPLAVGSNTITTIITAEDKVTTKTVIITIKRALSADAGLVKLVPGTGTLAPVFATATTSYSVSVANTTTSILFIPTTSNTAATVTVNGTAVRSGTGSASIPLAVGANIIKAIVTAQDGKTSKTYTVTVTRLASGNALLASVSLNPVSTLVGTTGTGYLNFTSSVANSETSVQVIPTAKDATATITVNGKAVVSGAASASIPLAVGANTITTVITAQDKTTKKSVIITVKRAAAPGIADLYQTTSVTKPADNIVIENDSITVHQGISPNGDGINDYLTIDGITNHPDNSLTIIDRNGLIVYQTKGYDNSTKIFDGHSNINGKMQLPGTYFYSLDYTVNGENKHKTGYIILKY